MRVKRIRKQTLNKAGKGTAQQAWIENCPVRNSTDTRTCKDGIGIHATYAYTLMRADLKKNKKNKKNGKKHNKRAYLSTLNHQRVHSLLGLHGVFSIGVVHEGHPRKRAVFLLPEHNRAQNHIWNSSLHSAAK
jgi:hypothetical protein